jgi:hypothetical protein
VHHSARAEKEGRQYVSENRTFFCSELVAKCYKATKIFNTNKDASSFMPKDLALPNKSLPLAKDTYFSDAFTIVLNQEEENVKVSTY